LVRAIDFLKNGKKKYFEVKKLHKQDGIWVIDEMSMVLKYGKKTLHKTILKFDNIEVNVPIEGSIFTIEDWKGDLEYMRLLSLIFLFSLYLIG